MRHGVVAGQRQGLVTTDRIATWNVLHWVHAQKYGEKAILSAFVTEEERARAVVDRVAAIEAEVKCLQEVSGDTLRLLESRFGNDRVHSFRLPRTPIHAGVNVLRDPSENLVIITACAGVVVHAQAFVGDDGKGLVAVRLADDTLVVCTHVSGDSEKNEQQLRAIDDWIGSAHGSVILCGDFNADIKETLGRLRPGWHAAVVQSPIKVSRPKSNQLIDHILSWPQPILASARIEAAAGLSDHNILIGTTRPPAEGRMP
jgi:endonuclease/exonuclease/phosphatase family metal-dependent hydrolase